MGDLTTLESPVEERALSVNLRPTPRINETQWEAKESYVQYCFRVTRELWAFRFAASKLIANSLAGRYRGSFFGFLWSLINPLLSMAVITSIFALIWGCDIQQFAPHIFSGLLSWTFISSSLEKGAGSLVASENLIKTIYAPKIMFPLVRVITEACNFLFSVVAFYIIGLFIGFQPSLALLALPVVIGLTALFCTGLSLILSVATVYFRDLSHILTIFLSLVFYMLPILYPVTKIPEAYRFIVYYDPFYAFVSLYQSILRDSAFPSVSQFAVASLLTLLSLTVGLFVLKKKENDIVFRL